MSFKLLVEVPPAVVLLFVIVPVIDGQRDLHSVSDLMFASRVFPDFEPRIIRCNESLVILVKSGIENMDRRQAIRETWGRSSGCRPMFVLGYAVDPLLMQSIVQEKSEFGDIVMGSFVDDYYNLTLKAVFALSWSRDHHPDKWLLYVDDDVLVHPANLRHFVNRIPDSSEGRIYCSVLKHGPVIRDAENKWFVDEDVYPTAVYPDYCSGSATLIPSSSRTRLLLSSLSPETKPKFWIDDVFITGIAAENANVTRVSSPVFNTYLEESSCLVESFESVVAGGQFCAQEMRTLWPILTSNNSLVVFKEFLKCRPSGMRQLIFLLLILNVVAGGLVVVFLISNSCLSQVFNFPKILVKRLIGLLLSCWRRQVGTVLAYRHRQTS